MTDRLLNTPIFRRPDFENMMPTSLLHSSSFGVRCFSMGETRIVITREDNGWHLSISCADRDPTWDEIATVRYRLLTEVPNMAMFLPKLEEYVNKHPFHFSLVRDRVMSADNTPPPPPPPPTPDLTDITMMKAHSLVRVMRTEGFTFSQLITIFRIAAETCDSMHWAELRAHMTSEVKRPRGFPR